MEPVNIPEKISYGSLLQVMFERSIAGMSDEDLRYFLDLVHTLRHLQDKVDTEAWWYRYYS